ncbi:hypothetical protein [Allosphingosinicella sp.]|jgi:hypothetical protein|uniref:polysaccharide deacetylase WbmS family protein n=1 Tax=Allosphingosinicella sp. TaxID=2823234 RepID=UPI002EE87884
MADCFRTISSVRPDDPESWDGRIFLTLDIDWAHDDVIGHAIDLIEAAGVAATWFVTHDTPMLERLRSNPAFELGIHPNFNFLLAGDPRSGATAEEVVDRIIEIVPEAKSVRSHSLVQSSRLLDLFASRGLTHDANKLLPEQSGMALRPWTEWSGMVRVPYYWEDDFWCHTQSPTSMAELLDRPGIRGFDFHPIHIFLNTERLERYESVRAHFQDPGRLAEARCPGRGTATMLAELLASAG